MNYKELQTQFQAILNRRDITPSLTLTFLNMGLSRISRELQVPANEELQTVTTTGSATIPVPTDLSTLISISLNDAVNQVKLERVDLQTAIRLSQYPGIPRAFARQGQSYLIGPYPPAGTSITINYYGSIPALSADTDTNFLTLTAPDLWIYAALGYGADYFMDERLNNFQARYQEILADLQGQALDDEMAGAVMLPVYGDCYP